MKFFVFLILKIDRMKSSVDGMLMVDCSIIRLLIPKILSRSSSELRYIDPRKIRKVTEYEQKRPEQLRGVDLNTQLTQKSAEYFLYNPKGLKNSTNQGMKITSDSVTYCHSGIQDLNKNMTLSHLHKAIKAVNQLRMIEDSLGHLSFVQSTRTKNFLH